MAHNGIVYLLHFERSYRHARLTQNLEQRRAGRGSPLIADGIDFQLAIICEGNRQDERRLHGQKNIRARLCPICVASDPRGGGGRGAHGRSRRRTAAQRARRDAAAGDADRHSVAAAPTREADREHARPT